MRQIEDIGLRVHDYMLRAETPLFFRVIGTVLFGVSIAGLWQSVF